MMNTLRNKFITNRVFQRGAGAFLDQFVFVLAGVMVFFNPFPHTTAIKEISFYVIVITIIALIASGRSAFSLRSPLTVPFALFVLWAGASTFWAIDVPNTIHDVYAHVIKCVVIYYVIVNYFSSEKKLIILTWILIVSTSIFALRGIVHFYIVMDIPLNQRLIHSTGAPVNSSAILNLFCAFLSFFFLTWEKRWPLRVLLFVCFAGTLTAMLLSYSRAALIALVISALVLLLANKVYRRWIIPALVALSLIVGGGYLCSPHLKLLRPEALCKDPRIGIYYTCVEICKDHPIAGVGFGGKTFEKHMWTKYNPKVPERLQSPEPASSPHGFVFDLVVRLGLVGLILFGLIILKALQLNRMIMNCRDPAVMRWGAYLLASLTGMLIAGFFGSILHGAAGWNVYILLAMITILWKLAQEKERGYNQS